MRQDHDDDDLSPSAKELFFKTKVCRFYAAGRCNRGKNCSFAHGEARKAPLPDFYRTRLCPLFMRTGACPRGEACNYAHNKQEIRASVTKETSNAAEESFLNRSTGLRSPIEPGLVTKGTRMSLQHLPTDANMLNGGAVMDRFQQPPAPRRSPPVRQAPLSPSSGITLTDSEAALLSQISKQLLQTLNVTDQLSQPLQEQLATQVLKSVGISDGHLAEILDSNRRAQPRPQRQFPGQPLHHTGAAEEPRRIAQDLHRSSNPEQLHQSRQAGAMRRPVQPSGFSQPLSSPQPQPMWIATQDCGSRGALPGSHTTNQNAAATESLIQCLQEILTEREGLLRPEPRQGVLRPESLAPYGSMQSVGMEHATIPPHVAVAQGGSRSSVEAGRQPIVSDPMASSDELKQWMSALATCINAHTSRPDEQLPMDTNIAGPHHFPSRLPTHPGYGVSTYDDDLPWQPQSASSTYLAPNTLSEPQEPPLAFREGSCLQDSVKKFSPPSLEPPSLPLARGHSEERGNLGMTVKNTFLDFGNNSSLAASLARYKSHTAPDLPLLIDDADDPDEEEELLP